jgi:hypothetical protein
VIVVKKRVGLVGQLIGGMVFMAAGLAIVYFLGLNYTLTCDRSSNACVIQEENILNEKQITATLNLSDIEKAEIVESRNSKGKSSYQVMLVTNRIRVPLSDVSSSRYGACNKIASKINQYLNSGDKDLSVTESGTLITILGFVFAGAGGFLFLHALGRLLKRMLGLILVLTSK